MLKGGKWVINRQREWTFCIFVPFGAVDTSFGWHFTWLIWRRSWRKKKNKKFHHRNAREQFFVYIDPVFIYHCQLTYFRWFQRTNAMQSILVSPEAIDHRQRFNQFPSSRSQLCCRWWCCFKHFFFIYFYLYFILWWIGFQQYKKRKEKKNFSHFFEQASFAFLNEQTEMIRKLFMVNFLSSFSSCGSCTRRKTNPLPKT